MLYKISLIVKLLFFYLIHIHLTQITFYQHYIINKIIFFLPHIHTPNAVSSWLYGKISLFNEKTQIP